MFSGSVFEPRQSDCSTTDGHTEADIHKDTKIDKGRGQPRPSHLHEKASESEFPAIAGVRMGLSSGAKNLSV